MKSVRRLPDWLKRSLTPGNSEATNSTIRKYNLTTVCESAICPNRNECYGQKKATFMILGNVCTRNCLFCAVPSGLAKERVDSGEPMRVAFAAKELGLRYVVVTSVTRDDLFDEGAKQFAFTITAVKEQIDGVKIEVLTPDFHARGDLIKIVMEKAPDVFNHNVETVERLQKNIRPEASYKNSLRALELAKRHGGSVITKSGMMLGMGETGGEVLKAGNDLLNVGVDILTLGQYLQPSKNHLEVQKYVHPEKFEEYRELLSELGFKKVYAGVHVRSSYHADDVFGEIETGAVAVN